MRWFSFQLEKKNQKFLLFFCQKSPLSQVYRTGQLTREELLC